MRTVNHFREPAAGVSRCECRWAVSCQSRFPEGLGCVGKSGRSRYHDQALIRALQSGRYAAIWVVPRLIRLVVPEVQEKSVSLWAFVLVRDLNLAEASLKSRAKIGEKETVR